MGYGSSLGTQPLSSMQGLAADSQSLDALKMQAGSNSRVCHQGNRQTVRITVHA